jgi:hypothetical protein
MKKNRFFGAKTPRVLTAMAALLLAIGLLLTGCPTDTDGEEEGPLETFGYTGVDLEPWRSEAEDGKASDITISKQTALDNGYEFSVSAGKLTVEFFKPLSTSWIDQEFNNRQGGDNGWTFFGRTDGDYKLTFVPEGGGRVGVRAQNNLAGDEWNLGYSFFMRSHTEFKEGEYHIESGIFFVYATGDVTITRGEKKVSGLADNWWNGKYAAVNLSLKEGWNLLQIDTKETFTPEGQDNIRDHTLKIVDQGLPWKYEKED